MSKTITLIRRKETKNKVVFEETVKPGEQEILGSLYVWKWAADKLGNEFDIELPIEDE